jgi:tRNA 2-selenouridine synthase
MNKLNFLPEYSKLHSGKIESFIAGLLDEVSVEEALSEKNTLIDVRTADEFKQGSIPDAQNYPLFDNMERAEIGTIYRKIGRSAAVAKGLGFFEPRVQEFLSSISDLIVPAEA